MNKVRITDTELTTLFEQFLVECETMNEEAFHSEEISSIAESILVSKSASEG